MVRQVILSIATVGMHPSWWDPMAFLRALVPLDRYESLDPDGKRARECRPAVLPIPGTRNCIASGAAASSPKGCEHGRPNENQLMICVHSPNLQRHFPLRPRRHRVVVTRHDECVVACHGRPCEATAQRRARTGRRPVQRVCRWCHIRCCYARIASDPFCCRHATAPPRDLSKSNTVPQIAWC